MGKTALMLRLMFVLFLFSMIVAGCKKGNQKGCPSETFEYHFKSNAKIDTLSVPPSDPSAHLIAVKASGTMRVFSYLHSYNVCPDMIDGGSTQLVLFEIDPSVIHFKFDGENLQTARCYYEYGNVLYSPGAYIPSGGTIEGTKINDQQWQVSINLTLKNNQTLNTSAIFKVE